MDELDSTEFAYHPRYIFFERYFKEGEKFLDHIPYESKLLKFEELFDVS
jgi:hypothetical protein